MTNITPIQGLRLSPGLDYSQIITQPYDVINPELQEKYYEKSPFNIIRLEYGKSLPGDNNFNNKYIRAARTFQEWLEKGILYQEEKPALYFYDQYFSQEGRKYLRRGLFCGVELSPFHEGNIIPHEETMDKPKADRLELMNYCEANFSPIFGLYRDKKMFIENLGEKVKKRSSPVIDFTDDEGQTHRIWAVTDPEEIAVVRRFFQEKKIFIADGHHRYETALQFYQQKRKETVDLKKYNHVLMALVNIYDEGLLSFPTHRLVLHSDIETGDLLSNLEKNFILHDLGKPEDKKQFQAAMENFFKPGKEEEISLGLYTAERKLLGLKLKNTNHFSFPMLDSFVLQELILETIFGLGEAERKDQSNLVYLKDECEAKEYIDSGKARYVFFLNRPPIEKIIDLAEKGIRMPQKTTYFYPKMITGLIMLKH